MVDDNWGREFGEGVKGLSSGMRKPGFRKFAGMGMLAGGAAYGLYALSGSSAAPYVAAAVAGYIGLRVFANHKNPNGGFDGNGRKRSDQTAGQDARFASTARLDELARSAGIVVGQRGREPTSDLLKYELEAHAITVAPARSGKGLLLNTTLLGAIGTWNGPVVAVDPKLENYCISAKRRRLLGRRVALLDPFAVVADLAVSRPDCDLDEIAISDKFNILDLIPRGEEKAVQIVDKLVAALVPESKGGDGTAQHFINLTRTYMRAGMLYVSEVAGREFAEVEEDDMNTGPLSGGKWAEGGFVYLDTKIGHVIGQVQAVDANGGTVAYVIPPPPAIGDRVPPANYSVDAEGIVTVLTKAALACAPFDLIAINEATGDRSIVTITPQLNVRQRTLPAVCELLINTPRHIICNSWCGNPHVAHGVPWSAGNLFSEMAEKEWSGVLSSTSNELRWSLTPQMRRHLGKSTFDIRDLLQDKLDIFLGAPATQTSELAPWYRLWATIPAILVEGYRPKKRILAILDEFPALGRIEVVPTAFRALPGLGVSFWAITQDLHAMEKVYGAEDAHSMMANAEVFQIFEINRNDWKTAETISKTLGEVTYEQTTTGKNRGRSARMEELYGTGSDGSSSNTNLVKDYLMRPDELVRMESGEMIVMIRFRTGEKRPVRCWRPAYFARPEVKDFAGKNPYFFEKEAA